MISLAGEYTDSKGRHARGWLFFDAECAFCSRFARSLAPSLRRRAIAVAPLQDPRVGALLGMTQQESLRELRFLPGDGRLYGGADAILAMAHEMWWARPVLWIARVPGMPDVLRAAYYRLAAQRKCAAMECAAAAVPRS